MSFFIFPSVIETKTLDLRTCKALENFIVKTYVDDRTVEKRIYQPLFGSIQSFMTSFPSLRGESGVKLSREQYPTISPIIGCAALYWHCQLSIFIDNII